MRRLGVSLAVVSWILAGAVGSAAADDGKQKRADELFEQGRKALADAGDDKTKIATACEKFDEAIKLDPEAPGTMLNLGLCNEKLDKYKTALYWFRKAQARASETKLLDYENAAKEHTVALALKVATIKIAFQGGSAPDGTKVKIDNDEIAPADYLHAEVDPGHHTLVAGAPGRKIFTRVPSGGVDVNEILIVATLFARATVCSFAARSYSGSPVSAARACALRNQYSAVLYFSSFSLQRPRFSIVPGATGSSLIASSNFSHAIAIFSLSVPASLSSLRPCSNAASARWRRSLVGSCANAVDVAMTIASETPSLRMDRL